MANTLEIIVQGTDKASKVLSGINGNIDQMGKKMQIAGAVITGVGVGIVGGLWKMADSYTKAGDEILKMSKRTGIATEALSEMKYMADLSGTSLGAMEVSIKRMQVSLVQAYDALTKGAQGNLEAQKKLGEETAKLSEERIKGLKDISLWESKSVEDAQIWLKRELEDAKTASKRKLDLAKGDSEKESAILLDYQQDKEDIQLRYARKVEDITREKTDKLKELESEYAEKLKSIQIEILTTSESATAAFAKLGLNIEMLKGMKPELQFWKIAEAIAGIEDPTLKAALATDIFGRSGTDLLPMLEQGKAGIAKMKQEAFDLNVVFSKDAAEAAEKFQDAKERIGKALAGLGAEIINDLIPVLTKYLDKLKDIIGKITFWAEANPKLAETLLKLGVVLLVGGGIIFALGSVARAITAINTALIIFQGVSGVGWIKLAAGLALAGLGIAAMYKLMEGLGAETGESPPQGYASWDEFNKAMAKQGTPSFQHGGIVPGPVGQPTPIIAHGGEMFLGENRAIGGVTVNITNNIQGSVIAERDLTEMIRTQLYNIRRYNVSLEMA